MSDFPHWQIEYRSLNHEDSPLWSIAPESWFHVTRNQVGGMKRRTLEECIEMGRKKKRLRQLVTMRLFNVETRESIPWEIIGD